MTYSEAAQTLAKKKATIEKKLINADKWTKNAYAPQLIAIENKLEELKQMNEQARMQQQQMEQQAMQQEGLMMPQEEGMEQEGGMMPEQGLDPNMMQQMMPQQGVVPEMRYGGLPKAGNGLEPNANWAIPLPKTTNYGISGQYEGLEQPSQSNNWQGGLETAGALLPTAKAFVDYFRKPDEIKPFTDNTNNALKQVGANAKYDIYPELYSNQLSKANIRQFAKNTGNAQDYMRYAVASETQGNLRDAKAYQWKQQMENADALQRGQLRANIISSGGDAANRLDYQRQLDNQAARAAKDVALNSALQGVSMYAQGSKKERLAKEKDQYLADMWARVYPVLSQYSPEHPYFKKLMADYEAEEKRLGRIK